MSGLIKDGMSALSRYYLNNFHDGIRQAGPYFIILYSLPTNTFQLYQNEIVLPNL